MAKFKTLADFKVKHDPTTIIATDVTQVAINKAVRRMKRRAAKAAY